MGSLGLPELLVVVVLSLIPAVLYIRTLQKALANCSPVSRTMAPGKVWLLLVPLFNLVWHFFVVAGISNSLRNEFARRNLPASEPAVAQKLGLAMCILMACSIIPMLGVLTSLLGLVCWIIYWVKISALSRKLQQPLSVQSLS